MNHRMTAAAYRSSEGSKMAERSPHASENMTPELKGKVLVFIVFLSALLVAGSVIWKIEESRAHHIQDRITAIAYEQSLLLHKNIDHLLALTYPIAAIIRSNGTVNEFDRLGEQLLTVSPYIKEIALAPDGVIAQIHPLQGNEKALGLDLLQDPKQQREAHQAKDTERMILAGPLQLVQGGTGLVGRLPVYRGTQKRFWGFVLIVLRFPDILQTTHLDQLPKEGFHYTLTRPRTDGPGEQCIASKGATTLNDPVVQTIEFPNTTWTLRVAPLHGWHDHQMLAIELLLGLLISFLLAHIAKQYVELWNYRHYLERLVETRTREITATNNMFHTLLDTIPDLIWLKDRDGTYRFCNPTFERFFGANEEEITGKTDYDFVDKELADFFREKDQQAMEAGAPSMNEEWVTFADNGHRALLETIKTPMYDEEGTLSGILGIARDITRRHTDEMQITQLSKMYATLSQCNQAIIHTTTPQELFEKICEYSVVLGGMSMAWIGLLDPHDNTVKPAAVYGLGKEYLEGINISTTGNDPSGRGPTGTAIREERPYWCQDFLSDPATAPWHRRAEAVGWRASAALPLYQNRSVIGAFMLYATTKDAFTPMMQALIKEMTLEVSFALDNFDRDAKRRASEAELLRTEQLLEEMSAMAHVGAWEFDPESGEGNWTEEVARIYDMDPDETTGREIGISVFSGEWRTKIETAIDDALRHGIPYDLELQMHTSKGNVKWVRTIGVPVTEDGRVVRLRGAIQEITAQKQAEEQAEWLSNFDPLTKLANRTLLNDRAAYTLRMAAKADTPVALMLLDLDHFKNINDALGHSVGDSLLVKVAERIRAVLREEDTLARQGGDEFLILLPQTNAKGAAHLAEKLIKTISRSYRIHEHDLTVTPSIGIALHPIDGSDLHALTRSADAAMYRAKHDGRNCYRFFTPEIQMRSARTIELENALRSALQRNELKLCYQPQLEIENQRVIGVEALLRWEHPSLGMVPPSEFIPIAEESGQIVAIGEWVLRCALTQLKTWIDGGMEPLLMAVNLSAIQFHDPRLIPTVLNLVDTLQLPASCLELELTERIAMENPQQAVEIMNKLHDHGIRMSIDDFGTGFSSLNYLKRFRVSKLKIDQSFIRDIAENPEDKTIVDTIINMAHNLRIRSIAEGVETAEQLKLLQSSGCDEVQGYYFSKPLRPEEFEAFQRRNRT